MSILRLEQPAVALCLGRVWWLSAAAATLAWTGSGVGLMARGRIHGRETIGLADHAVAQDVANLVVVAPLILLLGLGAGRRVPTATRSSPFRRSRTIRCTCRSTTRSACPAGWSW